MIVLCGVECLVNCLFGHVCLVCGIGESSQLESVLLGEEFMLLVFEQEI